MPETTEKAMPDELSQGEFSCIDKINPGEPIFVLRGQDQLAAAIVLYWAKVAEANRVNPEKVAGARQIADRMENYSPRKLPD